MLQIALKIMEGVIKSLKIYKRIWKYYPSHSPKATKKAYCTHSSFNS